MLTLQLSVNYKDQEHCFCFYGNSTHQSMIMSVICLVFSFYKQDYIIYIPQINNLSALLLNDSPFHCRNKRCSVVSYVVLTQSF